jgi:hypothetical protein
MLIMAPQDVHIPEHANGEFRPSDFLRDVNQAAELGDSLVTTQVNPARKTCWVVSAIRHFIAAPRFVFALRSCGVHPAPGPVNRGSTNTPPDKWSTVYHLLLSILANSPNACFFP